MIDPHQRGKRARRAFASAGPEIREMVRGIVRGHVEGVFQENDTLIRNARNAVRRKTVAGWCRNVASGSKGRIWIADAWAAIAAMYFGAAQENQLLWGSYRDQMGAILFSVLKRPVRSMKLQLLMGAEDGPAQAGCNAIREDDESVNLWQKIYLPLAEHVLMSLASLRLVDELHGPGRRTIYPFAWAPGADSLQGALAFALLGRTASRPTAGSLLYSTFARYVVRCGYAGIVPFQTFHCDSCWRPVHAAESTGHCAVCGSELRVEIRPQCLSIAYLQQCAPQFHADGRMYYTRPRVATAKADVADIRDRPEPQG